MSGVIDISPGNLDSSLCFTQPGISHDVLCLRAKVHRLPITILEVGLGDMAQGSRLETTSQILQPLSIHLLLPLFPQSVPLWWSALTPLKGKRKEYVCKSLGEIRRED